LLEYFSKQINEDEPWPALEYFKRIIFESVFVSRLKNCYLL